ncbi:hypothetical protein MTR67_003171 [Solanum verrucosum]|uniref:Uncharacterized protein n=1 Tax=Solanum verrucosum TaxID=315347 RepID=A0AAF0T940_SOLVR|nr:hypothetical protein MTR67_003171 [Solanum verrucosum]
MQEDRFEENLNEGGNLAVIEKQNVITISYSWEVEEVALLLVQQDQNIGEGERDNSVWVQQNLVKLSKLLGLISKDMRNCSYRKVWKEMTDIRGLVEGPWADCGDFNTTRFISEKRNARRRNLGMVEFSDIKNDLKLIDLSLQDGRYT